MKTKLLTTAEAARRLGVSPRTVQRACRSGALRAEWCGIMLDRIKGVCPYSVSKILKQRKGGNHA